MLQQTQVDTVKPYYHTFLHRFPTLQSLAEAPADAVMAAWSGLGYYRRARLLHQGVREVLATYGGSVPRDPALRRSLPGIGRYTAGAIGSIAFGLKEPLVDGNVARILCRLLAIQEPPQATAVQKQLWHVAEQLVQTSRPGDLNQAMMELGATLCTKRNPQCLICPLRQHCEAYRLGLSNQLPLAKKPARTQERKWVTVVLTYHNNLCLLREEGSLYGNLWNAPTREGSSLEDAQTCLRELNVSASAPTEVGSFRHILTHRRLSIHVFKARATSLPGAPLRAVALDELPTLGTSSLTRKALSLAGVL